ncbi:MAG: phage major capsid protein [Bacteroidales bacterium]|nr:phage major capsid protein [Bacteroidales bacterium]
MKRVQKFLRETKTGGMLGCKRRFQMRMMCFGLLIMCLCLTACVAGAVETGNFAPVATMAVLPAVAGIDMTQFAKKSEELTDEEKTTLGTIQKMMLETVQSACKGMVSPETLDERVKQINELIGKAQKEASDALESKLKEASDITETLRKDLNKVTEELAAAKDKLAPDGNVDNITKDNLKELMESDRYKNLENKTSKRTGKFSISLKSLRKKGVVSMSGNYSGSSVPAHISDAFVSEVPLTRPHMRDFMRVIDITEEEATTVYARQIYDIDRAALAVSENGRLPEGSFKVREISSDTKRIGWHMFVSRRMLRKVNLIVNRIMLLMPSGLANSEDFQILYGDGTDNNFDGIVKTAVKDTALTGEVYKETTAGKVKSIASYNSGNAVLVTLNGPYAKMKTGMKVVFSGFQTCTALNAAAGFEIKVVNDHTFVVDCAYTAETDVSVAGNATFTITDNWGELVVDANWGDALRCMLGYMVFDIYVPNMVVMSTPTLTALKSIKDKTGRPMGTEYVIVRNGIDYFDGIYPIVTVDAMPKGKVLVGDFLNAIEFYDTERANVEFAEDVNTKLENEVCVLIGEEVILLLTCPEAFMFGDLDTVVSIINKEGAPTKVAITSPLNDEQDALLMEAKQ